MNEEQHPRAFPIERGAVGSVAHILSSSGVRAVREIDEGRKMNMGDNEERLLVSESARCGRLRLTPSIESPFP